MNDIIKTFSEWNRLGFYINSGAKAKFFQNKEACFSRQQVHKANPIAFASKDASYHWMDAHEGSVFDPAYMFCSEPH